MSKINEDVKNNRFQAVYPLNRIRFSCPIYLRLFSPIYFAFFFCKIALLKFARERARKIVNFTSSKAIVMAPEMARP